MPSDATAPVIFALHFLGGSATEWDPLVAASGDRFRWVTVDLPGFGGAARTAGYSVAEMAATVGRAVGEAAPARWVLAGHSMGAKVACALARQAEDGAPGLGGLEALILLAGSPPSPEPMADEKRGAMLGWFAGDPDTSRNEAHGYIRDNIGGDLHPDLHERAVTDVLRTEPAAWAAWLNAGSREDWSERVGRLRTPALIVAGEKDAALGAEAQSKLMAPHFVTARTRTLPGAGHLLPLERPDALAGLIAGFLAEPTGQGRRAATLA